MPQTMLWTLKTRGTSRLPAEPALVPNNSAQHTSTPVPSAHRKRWSPKSWTKGTPVVDIYGLFHRGGPQTEGTLSVYYSQGWEGEWWFVRMDWMVRGRSLMLLYGVRGGERTVVD